MKITMVVFVQKEPGEAIETLSGDDAQAAT